MEFDSDDEYDPECSYMMNNVAAAGFVPEPGSDSVDSDYDPESIAIAIPQTEPVSEQPHRLLQALDSILHSDIVKHPAFIRLSQSEQVDLIAAQLQVLQSKSINQGPRYPTYNSTVESNVDIHPTYDHTVESNVNTVPTYDPSIISNFITHPAHDSTMVPYSDTSLEPTFDRLDNPSFEPISAPIDARVYIGNLPPGLLSQEKVFRVFRKHGQILEITIKSGYGFVQFSNSLESSACIRLESGRKFHGHTLIVKQCNPPRIVEYEPGNPVSSPTVMIFVSSEATKETREALVRELVNSALTYHIEALDDRPLSDLMADVANQGIPALCVIKHGCVCVHTFSTTERGDIRFDEYADMDPRIAAQIVLDAVCPREEYDRRSDLLLAASIEHENHCAEEEYGQSIAQTIPPASNEAQPSDDDMYDPEFPEATGQPDLTSALEDTLARLTP